MAELRLPVHPHPFVIEFGPYGLGGHDSIVAAALGELPYYDLGGLRIDPQKNRVRGLVDPPFCFIMPERIRKLSWGQAVAKSCPQADQVHALFPYVFDTMLAAEHEEREVEAGDHIRRELREVVSLSTAPAS